MDERAILHRYKATRWSMVSGLLAMFVIVQYELLTSGNIRWDLIIILFIMAFVKVTVRIILKKTN